MKKRGGIELNIGGDSWNGFKFGSYGNARDWRIKTPEGDAITAGDLKSFRAVAADLAYLQPLAKEQAEKLRGSSLSFTPDETHLVRVALQIIIRELPIQLGRRAYSARPALLFQAVK